MEKQKSKSRSIVEQFLANDPELLGSKELVVKRLYPYLHILYEGSETDEEYLNVLSIIWNIIKDDATGRFIFLYLLSSKNYFFVRSFDFRCQITEESNISLSQDFLDADIPQAIVANLKNMWQDLLDSFVHSHSISGTPVDIKRCLQKIQKLWPKGEADFLFTLYREYVSYKQGHLFDSTRYPEINTNLSELVQSELLDYLTSQKDPLVEKLDAVSSKIRRNLFDLLWHDQGPLDNNYGWSVVEDFARSQFLIVKSAEELERLLNRYDKIPKEKIQEWLKECILDTECSKESCYIGDALKVFQNPNYARFIPVFLSIKDSSRISEKVTDLMNLYSDFEGNVTSYLQTLWGWGDRQPVLKAAIYRGIESERYEVKEKQQRIHTIAGSELALHIQEGRGVEHLLSNKERVIYAISSLPNTSSERECFPQSILGEIPTDTQKEEIESLYLQVGTYDEAKDQYIEDLKSIWRNGHYAWVYHLNELMVFGYTLETHSSVISLGSSIFQTGIWQPSLARRVQSFMKLYDDIPEIGRKALMSVYKEQILAQQEREIDIHDDIQRILYEIALRLYQNSSSAVPHSEMEYFLKSFEAELQENKDLAQTVENLHRENTISYESKRDSLMNEGEATVEMWKSDMEVFKALPFEQCFSKIVAHPYIRSLLKSMPGSDLSSAFASILECVIFTAEVQVIPELITLSFQNRKEFLRDLVVESLSQKLRGLKLDRKGQLKYIAQFFNERNYTFHGTNSQNKGSIELYGLSTKKRVSSDSKVNELSELNKKFGWQVDIGFFSNCEEKFYVSKNPRVTYSYANRSPEWFDYFLNSFSSLSRSTKQMSIRDYQLVRKDLEYHCQKHSILGNEKLYLFQFFEEHWSIYRSNTHPIGVIVDNYQIMKEERKESFTQESIDDFIKRRKNSENTLQDFNSDDELEDFIRLNADNLIQEGDPDIPLKSDIAPQNLYFIDYPTGEDIYVSGKSSEELRLIYLRELLEERSISTLQLIDLLSQEFPQEFLAKVGVQEDYTLKEHTGMVLQVFDDYLGRQYASKCLPINLFRLFLCLHDIGKPNAITEGDRSLEHEYSVEYMKKFFAALNIDDRFVKIMLALVSEDPFGKYLKGQWNVQEAAQSIEAQARSAAINVEDLWQLLEYYFLSDAGSYTKFAGGKTSLDHLFDVDQTRKRLHFSTEVERSLAVLKREAALL